MRLLLVLAALLAAPSAHAATIGPDLYGYVAHPVANEFVSGIPNALNLALSTSVDQEVDVTLPWSFPWYGSTYSTVTVGSTGGVSFGGGLQVGYNNSCLPAFGTSDSDGGPDIAVFWDNLQPSYAGAVYAWEDIINGRFIISWEGVPHWSAQTLGISAQLHLYPTGEIEMHYENTIFGSGSYDEGNSATVGIQDQAGGTYDSLEWSCSSGGILGGTSVGFHLCGDWDGDGYISTLCGGTDCEDTQASVNPGEFTEVCDGFDTDCDGVFATGSTSGSSSSTSSGGGDTRSRGLKWAVTSDVTLESIEVYLSSGSSITYSIYESTSQSGTFSRIGQTSVTASSSGSWRTSAALNVSLEAGKYYVAVASWSSTRTYYWTNGASFSSLPCDFGNIVGGVSESTGSPSSSMSWSTLSTAYRLRINVSGEADGDGDGWAACNGDCDDGDVLRYPGAPERCNTLDDDCDGSTADEFVDGDFDGWTFFEDCDDTDSSVYPGAPEGCDFVDTDCDFAAGPDEIDNDGDGLDECTGDCDDTDPAILPGATEVCDGVDNDCDSVIPADEADADGDGYRICDGDCDDTNAAVSPVGSEICDGLDNDCNGNTPSNEDDFDGDGWRPCEGDCDDGEAASYPGAAEICDGLDNDCDQFVPANEEDGDNDGQFPCQGDCNDGDPDVYEGAPELCDGDDNDCDGTTKDENVDNDNDGVSACEGDCDDDNDDVSPDLTEDDSDTCFDSLDNDCDGDVDADDSGCDGVEPPADDDDAADDDDDSASTGDDDDDDDGGGGGGRRSRGCDQSGGTPSAAWLLLAGLAFVRRRA